MRPNCRVVRFPAPATVSTFRPGPAVSLRPPSTASLHLRFHPPASLSPSPEYCGLRPAPCAPKNLAASRKPKSASHGVPSLIATSASGVHSYPGNPAPSYVPSATFRTSSTVCSATDLAGLFHPAATSRVCPSGVCSSPRSRTGFPRPYHALLPLSETACGLTRASDPALDFRALLPTVSAVPTRTG